MNNTFKKRIDELGRIVIPKQIRNTFKIKDFDELELYIENDNIIIKKTGGILLIKDKLNDFLQYIKKYNNINAFITDKNTIIASNIIELTEGLEINMNDYINGYNNFLKCNTRVNKLIYDSNLYGNIVFVLNEESTNYDILFNDVVKIIIDFIK